MKCPNCGFTNPGQFKFCGECGNRLIDFFPTNPTKSVAGSTVKEDKESTSTIDAERRHITVMFCDLVESTKLSAELDPEDFREVLHVYQDTCSYIVNRFNGHVAQYLGDGILVYFGYPRAHTDDSQRAILSGLEIVEEMENLSNLPLQNKGIKLAVRIGIHTGLVVVGDFGNEKRHERLALGNTPNIAARLQGFANPNTIIISSVTHRLIRNNFECQPIGEQTLKGISRPMNLYKVIKMIIGDSGLIETLTTRMTPFVGRENEVRKLLGCWEQVKAGRGRVALIIGEPGIGKTRLLRVFEENIADELHTWLVCRCLSYHQNSAFYPIINLLKSVLNFSNEDTAVDKLEKIEKELSRYKFDLSEVVPPLASLLSIPFIQKYAAPSTSPPKQKQQMLEVLLRWLLQYAEQKPLLFVIEDLHWSDPSTLEHLTLLMENINQARILIILTFHPQFRPPSSNKLEQTEIMLTRLARQQVEKMVAEVTNGKKLPAEVIDLLLTKTDGVPLFVEELTKMLVESDFLAESEQHFDLNGPLPDSAIPDTLQDTLMARLDQLGTEKEVVQIAATIGREFSYELILEVATLDDHLLQKELNTLVVAEIIVAQGVPPHALYSFRQALIQDAAYNSLLKSTRQQYHRKIARLMEERFTDIVQKHPDLIAHHYAEAGDPTKAIRYYLQAGKLLVQNSANLEAIRQLNNGMDLLKYVSDNQTRSQLELELQIILGIPLVASKGYSAPEVRETYERARELSQKVGDVPRLFPALHGLYRFYLLSGQVDKGTDIAELLLSWAQTSKIPEFRLEANRSIGVSLFHLGNLSLALEHLKKSIELYDPVKHKTHALLYGSDPKVTCLSYAALAECLLGFPDAALKSGKGALNLAKKIAHPFSLAFCLNHHAWFFQFRRETDKVKPLADELVKVAKEVGYPFWLASGTYFKGWVQMQENNIKDGIELMIKGVSDFRATGAGLVLPFFLSMLAESYMQAGLNVEANDWLTEAETIANKNNEHFYDAEILRLRGELLLPNYRQEAEAHFYNALSLSKKQNLKALELRTTISLARLWVKQGKQKEAYSILKDICAWFENDTSTCDLKIAREILETLSSSRQ